MMRLLLLVFILLLGKMCNAQPVKDIILVKTDSMCLEWERLEDSMRIEWDKMVTLIMNAPQFSDDDKKELTNYCTGFKFRTAATEGRGIYPCLFRSGSPTKLRPLSVREVTPEDILPVNLKFQTDPFHQNALSNH